MKTKCNVSCEYWKFPHLDTACELSGIFSVTKGSPCEYYKESICTQCGNPCKESLCVECQKSIKRENAIRDAEDREEYYSNVFSGLSATNNNNNEGEQA